MGEDRAVDPRHEYVTEIARLFPMQGKWTEEDFFALPESNSIIELSNGHLYMVPAPELEHQSASTKLVVSLGNFVDEHHLGVVFHAPTDVRLFPGTIRQPDVVFLSEEHRDRMTEHLIEGAPDWVAEIISPSTRRVDEVEKMHEYARAGVPEYWLLDLEKRTIRVYTLQHGAYGLSGAYGAGETAKSVTLVGFTVAVDTIFGGV